jgi:hypothetical protein
MRTSLLISLVLWVALNPLPALVASPSTQAPQDNGIGVLLRRVEKALRASDAASYLGLLSATANVEQARQFAAVAFSPGTTRAVVRERDRGPLKGTLRGNGYSLLVEVLVETGARARLSTWRLDVERRFGDPNGEAGDAWAIMGQESLSTLQGLYRLSLDPQTQFAANDVTFAAEDFQLTMKTGSAFVAEAGGGPTAIVLIGSGEITFRPAPAAERDQVKIFCGSDTLRTSFDAAFLRLSPGELYNHLVRGALIDRPVDQRDLQRADGVFAEEIGKSFGLDLSDLSPDAWSLAPTSGDFLAEVRTRRFETLTYARSHGEPEDVTLFDRKRHRNIALYSSREKLATQGRFYDEDALEDYEVLDYDIDATFAVNRLWINGRARMEIVTKAPSLSALSLRLAESLSVRAVVSNEFGRLLALRVRNQNSVVVNLPSTMPKGTKLTLTVLYDGRLQPQSTDREIIAFDQIQGTQEERVTLPAEESYLYSNRSYWYPQAPSGNYATAVLRLSVPAEFSCVASGDLISNAAEPGGTAPNVGGKEQETPTRLFIFRTGRPVRYLSCLITRLVRATDEEVQADAAAYGGDSVPGSGSAYRTLSLRVEANPRQQGRGRQLAERATGILRFYSSLFGDFPYPSLTCALVERDLPGGHSPAYLAILNQQLPGSTLVWRDDPASFPGYPDFFLAHEIAHQWWGQAVGWKNYHEQWLSEGVAQYFAVLYAERARGPVAFGQIVRQLHGWAIRDSDQGAVYLGYRVGHIKRESRIFRAVVYNKSAAVLHMLRRLIGDDAFFRGFRRFYQTWRFRKAGAEDLRQALEAEAHVPLERFFERWIYNASLPDVKFSSRTVTGPTGPEVVLRFEQAGEIFDFPVTVTLFYADGRSSDVLVKVTDRVVETRVPLTGRLRRVEANRDEATVAEFPG